MVKEKPILFCTDMVRAILEDAKGQTRRVVKGKRDKEYGGGPSRVHLFSTIRQINGIWYGCDSDGLPFINDPIQQPRKPGDILWVRETWQEVYETEYNIDNPNEPLKITDLIIGFENLPKVCVGLSRECSCLSMPARNKYYVYTASKPEYTSEKYELKWRPSIHMPREAARLFLRVTDVWPERVQDISEADAKAEGVMPLNGSKCGYRGAFRELWNTLNAKRGFDWYTNNWVWVNEFERVKEELE